MNSDMQVREMIQPLASGIKELLPPGWGMALFVFPMEGREGNLNYISTADRKTMIEAVQEWLKRNGASIENFGKHESEIT